jgi:membrane protein required for colicin V production
MADFNGLDYAVLILLFLSIALGIVRGFVKEMIALLAWIAAFVVATLYSVKFAALFVTPPTTMPTTTNPIDYLPMAAIIISYLTLFVGVLICGSIVKFIASYAVEGGGLSLINRFLGSLLGLARGLVLVIIIMFFLTFTAIVNSALWKESSMVSLFKPGVHWVTTMAQPYIAVITLKMKKTMKGLDQEEDEMPDVIKAKPTVPAGTMPEPTAPLSVVPVMK